MTLSPAVLPSVDQLQFSGYYSHGISESGETIARGFLHNTYSSLVGHVAQRYNVGLCPANFPCPVLDL